MIKNKYYSGIGSRNTPPDIKDLMKVIAEKLAEKGFTLRSGSSPGADIAFEKGALEGGGKIELYLPFSGFQNHSGSKD